MSFPGLDVSRLRGYAEELSRHRFEISLPAAGYPDLVRNVRRGTRTVIDIPLPSLHAFGRRLMRCTGQAVAWLHRSDLDNCLRVDVQHIAIKPDVGPVSSGTGGTPSPEGKGAGQ